MAYVGNRQGPRESDIILRLGPSYFGITQETLEAEIEWHLEEEARGEIAPVRRDQFGKHFIIYSAPDKKTQNFYLEDNGYVLQGDIRIWGPDQDSVEIRP